MAQRRSIEGNVCTRATRRPHVVAGAQRAFTFLATVVDVSQDDSGVIDLMALKREADEEARQREAVAPPIPSGPPPAIAFDVRPEESLGAVSIPDALES